MTEPRRDQTMRSYFDGSDRRRSPRAAPAPAGLLREAAQMVINEWTLTIAEGGLVTIALEEPIEMLRAALAATGDSEDELAGQDWPAGREEGMS